VTRFGFMSHSTDCSRVVVGSDMRVCNQGWHTLDAYLEAVTMLGTSDRAQQWG